MPNKDEKTHHVQRTYYQALDYFYHVVLYGNLKSAALALDVKPQTISKSIKANLTDGQPLNVLMNLTSSSKSDNLTALGNIYYKYGEKLVELKKELHLEVTRFDHYRNSRVFTIAATPFFMLNFIPDLLKLLKANAPKSTIRTITVSEASSIDEIHTNEGSISTLLIENQIDLFLGSNYPYQRHYSKKELATEDWKLVFHARDWNKLYDSVEEPFIEIPIEGLSAQAILSSNNFVFCDYMKIRAFVEDICPEVNVVAEVSDYGSLIMSLRKMGLFSIVPESIADYANNITSGEILYTDLPEGFTPPPFEVCAYLSSYNVHSDAGKYLQEELRNLTQDYYSVMDE